MGSELRTTTDLAADPEAVWATLVDVGAWSAWNPTLFDVEGELKPGSVLRMRLSVGRFSIPMRQQIIAVSSPHQLLWRSQFGPRWLMSVIRGFQVTGGAGGGTRLEQFETATGLFGSPVFALMGGEFRRGHSELARGMGERLKGGAG